MLCNSSELIIVSGKQHRIMYMRTSSIVGTATTWRRTSRLDRIKQLRKENLFFGKPPRSAPKGLAEPEFICPSCDSVNVFCESKNNLLDV